MNLLISIARKPVSESSITRNVAAYESGGLNVDAARLFCGTEHMRGIVKGMTDGGMTAADGRTGKSLGRFEPGKVFQATDSPLGRWPANALLEHRPDCKETGTMKVTRKEWSRFAGSSGPDKVYGGGGGAADRQTDRQSVEEHRAIWQCAEGCPVKEMDRQSGTLHSNGNIELTTSSNKDVIYTGGWLPRTRIIRTFDNGGGASRFFKQVQQE